MEPTSKAKAADEYREMIQDGAHQLALMADEYTEHDRFPESATRLAQAIWTQDVETARLTRLMASQTAQLIKAAATSLAPMANGKAPYDGVLSFSSYEIPSTYSALSASRAASRILRGLADEGED
jgi:hypothetical protein